MEQSIKELEVSEHMLETDLENIDEYVNNQIVDIPDKIICDYMLQEIEETKGKIIEVNKVIQSIQSMNIIYAKYWNLPALTSIYEYFLTGRCSELTGADGAYNLYEGELRSAIIIDKLDVIIDKLDDIKNTQYQLYSLMLDIQNNMMEIGNSLENALSEIKGSLGNIESLSAVIAYNSTKSVYYEQQTNKLLQTLKYIAIIK
jgi:hypothetical protein